MKVFLGVILAVIVVALVFRLTKKNEGPVALAPKQATLVENQAGGSPMHNVVVEEVIQGTSYTYLRVKENKLDYWIATVKNDVAVGSKYSFGNALEMTNFQSKELGRTFSTIYFVSENPESEGNQQNTAMPPTTMGRPKVELKTDIAIKPSQGGISIAELYKSRDNYANKKVRVKGKVVKVNNQVMDRNWIHIQDGTSDSGNFDLTVTSNESAELGDVVEFEGTIILNKDYGAGYVYEVIMESGSIVKPTK
jgi:hypothetical protein